MSIKAAITLIMRKCHGKALVWYMMQHQKSLMLHWHSVDSPFKFISRIGLCTCRVLFDIFMLRIHWLWITASNSLLNWHTSKTNNRWRSVDTHFQILNVTMLRSVSRIMSANTVTMDISEHIALQSSWVEVQKSLTLHWHSISKLGCYNVTVCFADTGCR